MASSLHKDEPETREKDKASTNGPSRWLSVKKKGPASRSKSRERKLAEDENTESTESGKQEKPEKERVWIMVRETRGRALTSLSSNR